MQETSDSTIDLRGLRCPLPVLKTRKAVKALAPGSTVTILVTDPGAPDDMQDFCTVAGHQWLGAQPLADHMALSLRLKV